jgi:hypothetical protein
LARQAVLLARGAPPRTTRATAVVGRLSDEGVACAAR